MLQPKYFPFITHSLSSIAVACLIASLLIPVSFVSSAEVGFLQDNKQDKTGDKKTDDAKKVDDKKSDQEKGDEKKADTKKQTDKKAATDDKKSGTETTEPSTKKSDHPVDQLMDEWGALRMEMQVARQRYLDSVVKDDIDKAENDYMALYDQAMTHIDKIKSTALERIQKDASDETSIKALAGILINLANQEDQDQACFELAEQMHAVKVETKYFQIARDAKRLSLFNKTIFDEIILRIIEKEDDDLPRVKITTDQGDVVVELFENEAPDTVGNFISLVDSKFFEGSPFHRVLDGFMAQGGGAPKGKDEVDYKIYCECTKADVRNHFTGSISMAHAGRDTGNSEFFLTFKRTHGLDRNHTVFGRVIEGMDVVNKITRTFESVIDPATGQGREIPIQGATATKIEKMEVLRRRQHEYKPNKVGVDRPDNNPKVEPTKSKDDKSKDDKTKDDQSKGGGKASGGEKKK